MLSREPPTSTHDLHTTQPQAHGFVTRQPTRGVRDYGLDRLAIVLYGHAVHGCIESVLYT